MALWQSLASQVNALSAVKTSITSVVCNSVGEDDRARAQFVAAAKQFIADASRLVDSVTQLNGVPSEGVEALKGCCRLFSRGKLTGPLCPRRVAYILQKTRFTLCTRRAACFSIPTTTSTRRASTTSP